MGTFVFLYNTFTLQNISAFDIWIEWGKFLLKNGIQLYDVVNRYFARAKGKIICHMLNIVGKQKK